MEQIVNSYSYCGFTIQIITNDDLHYLGKIEPEIDGLKLYSRHQQHTVEKEIEEQIDKYLDEKNK